MKDKDTRSVLAGCELERKDSVVGDDSREIVGEQTQVLLAVHVPHSSLHHSHSASLQALQIPLKSTAAHRKTLPDQTSEQAHISRGC